MFCRPPLTSAAFLSWRGQTSGTWGEVFLDSAQCKPQRNTKKKVEKKKGHTVWYLNPNGRDQEEESAWSVALLFLGFVSLHFSFYFQGLLRVFLDSPQNFKTTPWPRLHTHRWIITVFFFFYIKVGCAAVCDIPLLVTCLARLRHVGGARYSADWSMVTCNRWHARQIWLNYCHFGEKNYLIWMPLTVGHF